MSGIVNERKARRALRRKSRRSDEVIGTFKKDIYAAEEALSEAKTNLKDIQYKIFTAKFVEACGDDVAKIDDVITFLTNYRAALDE